MPSLNAVLMGTNGSHFSGSASSGKIASTGHSGSHAPQSMHSSGSITRIRSASWMQSTGQTSTQERSLMSMQGSAMMYVKAGLLYRGDQLLDEVPRPFVKRRFDHHLVESGRLRSAEASRIRVVREAEDRHVRIRVRDLLRVDPRDVADHELRVAHAVGRDQAVAAEETLELGPEEKVDARQQDRRHAHGRVIRCQTTLKTRGSCAASS